MKKYIIKGEFLNGVLAYMIYVRIFWIFDVFIERWNTYESATNRIKELKENKSSEPKH
jgi:hypothetical protein